MNKESDKYGETAQTASDDVCGKCIYIKSDLFTICKHCKEFLRYNEYYINKKTKP